MKHFVWIFGIYLMLTACRSSYDEAQHKTEIKANPKATPTSPQVESPNLSTGSTGSGSNNGSSGTSAPKDNPSSGSQANSESNPLPGADPSSIMAQHEGTAEELKKYNCKGTALITDTGLDRNRDGILQDAEIQETRIDCTEVVPGGN